MKLIKLVHGHRYSFKNKRLVGDYVLQEMEEAWTSLKLTTVIGLWTAKCIKVNKCTEATAIFFKALVLSLTNSTGVLQYEKHKEKQDTEAAKVT